MSSLGIAGLTLGCMVGGVVLGAILRNLLPEHHRQDDTKDVVKTMAGMMATLVALIIGLLVSSAKGSFDTTNSSITQMGAKVISLDRILSRYGTEAQPIRQQLRSAIAAGVQRIWPDDKSHDADIAGMEKATAAEDVYDRIRELPAKDESQQYLKSQALSIGADLMQSRWMMIEQSQNSLPTAFLIVLVFWLAVLFGSFGLLAPKNLTAITALFICAISMAGAIFLIMELNRPLEGTIKVSSAPLQKAISVMVSCGLLDRQRINNRRTIMKLKQQTFVARRVRRVLLLPLSVLCDLRVEIFFP